MLPTSLSNAALSNVGSTQQLSTAALFASADKDRDKALNRDEFANFLQRMPAATRAPPPLPPISMPVRETIARTVGTRRSLRYAVQQEPPSNQSSRVSLRAGAIVSRADLWSEPLPPSSRQL